MKIKWDTSKRVIHIHNMTLIRKNIPLKKIRVSFDRSVFNTAHDKESFEYLRKAMIAGKTIEPILLEKRKGFYTIFDGNHRYYVTLDLLGIDGYIMAWVV
jgi:hypothetical protein